ncbi:MAG: endolytic transglycosylase MltG [Eubacterium sp.]|nr:endolytic transglycosylase MltG [Eubacterium sp.]
MARETDNLKKTFRIIRRVIIVLLFVLICVGGYRVMYDAFADVPMAEEDSAGRDVVVRIDSGMSTYKVAVRLKDNGLIKSPLVFMVQEKLFMPSGSDIQPGTYTLNTTMSAEDILAAFAEGDDYDSDESEEDSEEET